MELFWDGNQIKQIFFNWYDIYLEYSYQILFIKIGKEDLISLNQRQGSCNGWMENQLISPQGTREEYI